MEKNFKNSLEIELKNEIAALDNLYTQIKLHHERRDFEKAYEIFEEANKRNERVIELKALLKLQATV